MDNCTPNKEELVAMAVAVVAEDMGTIPKRIRVVRFQEVRESSLARYLKNHGIKHKKFSIEVQNDDEI